MSTYRNLNERIQDQGGYADRKTLRDEFAMYALTGILSTYLKATVEADKIAGYSYQMADAMLKARES